MSKPQQDPYVEPKLGKAPAFLQRTAFGGRVKGHIEISGPLLPGQDTGADTLMCVHCQYHWIIQPGSGMKRGWCGRCGGPTCGKRPCETRCMPFEKALEILESGGHKISHPWLGAKDIKR